MDETAARHQRRTFDVHITGASFNGGFQFGIGFVVAVWGMHLMLALALGTIWAGLMLVWGLFSVL